MSDVNLFELASRMKFRFDTTKGQLSVEDLWDIPMTGKVSLDAIAIDLNKKLKDTNESFVVQKSSANKIIEYKFDLVKYVIQTRLAEIEARQKEKENKEKKQKILQIIEEKENESLKNMSIEELKKMI